MKNLIYLAVIAITIQSCATAKKAKIIVPKLPQVTGNASELTKMTFDDIAEFRPSLSPDGTQLLYDVRDDSKRGSERWSIRLIRLGQAGFTPLTSSSCIAPTWFPDNKTYSFSYQKPYPPVIAKSSITNPGITYITQNGLGDFDNNPNVSPDGTKILLETSIQNISHIGYVNKDGQQFTILGEGENPAWSKNGDEIVFNKTSSGKSHIFLMNISSNQVTQITSGKFDHSAPKFSPDGNKICFASDRDGDEYHIYTINIDGTNLSQLTRGKARDYYPFWGSDGYIYFCSNAGSPLTATSIWSYSDIWRVKPIQNNLN